MNKNVYLVDGIRTPFCKMGSNYARTSAAELGTSATKALFAKMDLNPDVIDESVMGCVCQPADTANITRVIALKAGVPKSVPAYTVHRNCASGFESITQAHDKINAGRGSIYLSGGTENMTNAPFLYSGSAVSKFTALSKCRTFRDRLHTILSFRPKDFAPIVSLRLGLSDITIGMNMGETAELIARENGVTRYHQDKFALESHLKAEVAKKRFAQEISPYYFPDGTFVDTDNGIRGEQSMGALEKLRPVFDRKQGTVTAGNASQITDGAVSVLIADENAVKENNWTPLGRISAYAYAGCDPERMGLGPVHAIQKVCDETGYKLDDFDLIEVNEAFAAQVLAVCKQLKKTTDLGEVDFAKLNVNGGAIALGHPVGSSGSRIALTTLKELERRGGKRALISLCIGGGQGGAIILERD
jgi:acetyl-CoA C-acetyltransferase/acetyl-CoA acyltransferase